MEQVARGLYGPLIVEEAESPDIDAEHVLVLDDWRLTQTAEIDPDFAAPHDLSHAGRMGNYIATNATFNLTKTVKQHQRLRLRLINASNARIFSLALQGLEGWIMAYDGMPLPSPERIEKEFILAPAQRMDLFVDVIAAQGEEAYLVRLDQDKGAAQVSFVVEGQGSSVRRDTPVVLPPNADPALNDIDSANRVTMKIEGGAMGRLSSAMLDGKNVSFRDMSSAGKYWAMAGNVGMPDTPLVDAGRGETVRISMVNESAFPHAMHLHGMHFREVMPDGSFGPLRDTYLLPGRETREIAFLADNPGKWLFHCHMLGHAAAGMMQWMRVA
jgi:FtsP/CotA-like multicopper oxidase with cupredoxin domain